MGFGDDELGLKLMVSFLRTLKEIGSELWRLVLVNNGVKLTIDTSEVRRDGNGKALTRINRKFQNTNTKFQINHNDQNSKSQMRI
jgi:hypothetical protein